MNRLQLHNIRIEFAFCLSGNTKQKFTKKKLKLNKSYINCTDYLFSTILFITQKIWKCKLNNRPCSLIRELPLTTRLILWGIHIKFSAYFLIDLPTMIFSWFLRHKPRLIQRNFSIGFRFGLVVFQFRIENGKGKVEYVLFLFVLELKISVCFNKLLVKYYPSVSWIETENSRRWQIKHHATEVCSLNQLNTTMNANPGNTCTAQIC